MAKNQVLIIVVSLIAIIGWLGLGTTTLGGAASPAHATHSNPVTLPRTLGGSSGARASAPAPPSAGPTAALWASNNPGAEMADRALAATRAAGLNPDVAFVPHPSASPAQIAAAEQSGAAAPLYEGAPAPSGLADYGLSTDGNAYVASYGSNSVDVVQVAEDAIVATVPVGTGPAAVAFDAASDDAYVVNYLSDNVSVISGATNSVIATITVGTSPVSVAYDPQYDQLYVADYGSAKVTVIDGETNGVVATISVGFAPSALACDEDNGEVYVTNEGSGNVSVIRESSNRVVGSIPVGLDPVGVAYDPGNNELYVANNQAGNVSVINGSTNLVVKNIGVGAQPLGVAYGGSAGDIYVVNGGSNNVSVISGSTNTVVANVGVGSEPAAAAYSSQNNEVYVANYGSGNLTVLDGTTNVAVGSIKTGAQPHGIADGGGPSVLQTTQLQGIVAANATGIVGQDLYQSTPDGFSIQLNAVLTNVTLQGTSGYQFWTQNIVTYYPTAGYMVLVTNVWNFSSPGDHVNASSIYAHGPYGTNLYGKLGYYFANWSVPKAEAYPFQVTLSMDSTVSDGRNNVSFGAEVESPTDYHDDFNMTDYDWVEFNSTTSNSTPVSVPSPYTASGLGYNRVGLWDDFELVVTGPGGASQVDLASADADLSLDYGIGNDTFGAVPSAYSYGSDTGETSTGAHMAWSDSAIGPDGLAPYGTMTTGPAFLSGLWGEDLPVGSDAFTIDMNPANAFTFLQYLGDPGDSGPIVQQYEFTPLMTTPTVYLMPGNYLLSAGLADHDDDLYNFSVPMQTGVTVILPINTAMGLYTPLWAFSNFELAEISQSGAGTPTNPYILYNNQLGPLSSTYGLYNDYTFPVFPGVFLRGTSASVELNNSSTFQTTTNSFQPDPYEFLPATNDLQFWFWGVSNVSIHNATNISGWFGGPTYFPLTFNSFNVVFYASQHNLIANNVFLTEGQGLLLYSSGSAFSHANIGGGNNTIWGNRFVETDPPLGCPARSLMPPVNCTSFLPYNSGLGIEVAENTDLIYNNLFDTPTTAWLLPLNLYSGFAETYSGESWNITPEPASSVNYATYFPTIPLSGSVVGNSTQGGNSWWDYGVTLNWANGADNPTGVLPYDENARNLLDPETGYGEPLPGYSCLVYYCSTYIYGGGDRAPQPTEAAEVTLGPQGLVSGASWGAVVSCGPAHGTPGGGPPQSLCCGPAHGTPGGGPPGCNVDPPALVLAEFVTNASAVHLVLPNGAYNWTPIAPPGYSSAAGGTIVVSQSTPVSVTIPYVAPGKAEVAFSESGLTPGLTWQVSVAGTPESLTTNGATDSLYFSETLDATYPYVISAISGWSQTTLPYSGSVPVETAPTTEPTLSYTNVVYPVTFSESGLPPGASWWVNLTNGQSFGSTSTSLGFDEPNGTFGYTIATSDRIYSAPGGTFTVLGAAVTRSVAFTLVTYAVTFVESGLPAGASWWINLTDGQTFHSTTNTISFSEPNGSYSYTPATSNKNYAAGPGTFTVHGASVTVPVAFALVTYPVSFSESGLPGGLVWSVTFNAVTESVTTLAGTTTLTFPSEPNGTYAYTIAPNPGYHESTIPYSGKETVHGAALAIHVTYTQVTYSVTFAEVGLPSGLTWKVTVNGVSESLKTNGLLDVLTWTGLPNGTYAYSISNNPGFHEYLVAYNGKIVVNGGPVAVALIYLPVLYTVTFSESGLPAGHRWTVTVDGISQTLTTNGGTDTLTWSLVNGTYSYAITSISGWTQPTLPSTGSLTVNGAALTEPTLRYVS